MNMKTQKQTRDQKIALYKLTGTSKSMSKYAVKREAQVRGVFSPKSPFGRVIINNSSTED